MLHRNIVERVGTPQPKLFLWGDETEYYYRITRKNRIPVCTIADSIHYHPAAAVTYKNDWDYKNTWKMYFYVRNRFAIQQAKFGNKAIALVNYCCFLMAFAGIIMVYQKTDKLKKIGFIVWPATDAFANNFSATPQLILSRLNHTPVATFKNSLTIYWKNALTFMATPFALLRARRTANA